MGTRYETNNIIFQQIGTQAVDGDIDRGVWRRQGALLQSLHSLLFADIEQNDEVGTQEAQIPPNFHQRRSRAV